MKIPFSFGKNKPSDDTENTSAQEATADTATVEENEVDTGTKIKVVAALLVVAFATYIAYWVQEPTDVKVDVLGSTQETTMSEDPMIMESDVLVAAADSTQESSLSEANSQEVEVSIIDFAFIPANVTVDKGTTVVWTNKDTVAHTVTGPDFSSGTLNPGESYTYTFDEDGTFDYTCTFHPQMQATVTVGAAAEADSVITQEAEIISAPVTPLTEEVTPIEILPTEEVTPVLISAPAPTPSEEELALDAQALLESQAMAAAALEEATHQAAAEGEAGKLAKSGPEDIIYFAAFGVILYLNRRKLSAALR